VLKFFSSISTIYSILSVYLSGFFNMASPPNNPSTSASTRPSSTGTKSATTKSKSTSKSAAASNTQSEAKGSGVASPEVTGRRVDKGRGKSGVVVHGEYTLGGG
jgi:cytoskeletal protein RodZ